MQDFFGNLLGAILVTAWIVWGIRVAHRVWNSEDHSGKFLMFFFFFKGTFLYLIFYWIPIQFYLLFKKIQTREQGTTIRRNIYNDIDTLLNADLIAMKTSDLEWLYQRVWQTPPSQKRELLLSKVDEILKKRGV